MQTAKTKTMDITVTEFTCDECGTVKSHLAGNRYTPTVACEMCDGDFCRGRCAEVYDDSGDRSYAFWCCLRCREIGEPFRVEQEAAHEFACEKSRRIKQDWRTACKKEIVQ